MARKIKKKNKDRGAVMQNTLNHQFDCCDVEAPPYTYKVILDSFMPIEKEHESICLEAHRITNKDRRDEYGHPLDDMTVIAKLWEIILKAPVTAEQVCLCMI